WPGAADRQGNPADRVRTEEDRHLGAADRAERARGTEGGRLRLCAGAGQRDGRRTGRPTGQGSEGDPGLPRVRQGLTRFAQRLTPPSPAQGEGRDGSAAFAQTPTYA